MRTTNSLKTFFTPLFSNGKFTGKMSFTVKPQSGRTPASSLWKNGQFVGKMNLDYSPQKLQSQHNDFLSSITGPSGVGKPGGSKHVAAPQTPPPTVPPTNNLVVQPPPQTPPQTPPPPSGGPSKVTTSSTSSTSSTSGPPGGFADQWNTIRFSNTTNAPLTVQITVGAGQSMPPGVGSNGQFTLQPGESKDLTFQDNGPGFNFKTTTGDGSAWNQGEVTFTNNGSSHSTAFDMSYIYGANSNMNIYSSDGQVAGYKGNLFANVPANAKAGNWGIAAPLTSGSADNLGPSNPTDPAASYLYNIIPKGAGYVGVGKPAENTAYDDASTLETNGNLAVVFS